MSEFNTPCMGTHTNPLRVPINRLSCETKEGGRCSIWIVFHALSKSKSLSIPCLLLHDYLSRRFGGVALPCRQVNYKSCQSMMRSAIHWWCIQYDDHKVPCAIHAPATAFRFRIHDLNGISHSIKDVQKGNPPSSPITQRMSEKHLASLITCTRDV